MGSVIPYMHVVLSKNKENKPCIAMYQSLLPCSHRVLWDQSFFICRSTIKNKEIKPCIKPCIATYRSPRAPLAPAPRPRLARVLWDQSFFMQVLSKSKEIKPCIATYQSLQCPFARNCNECTARARGFIIIMHVQRLYRTVINKLKLETHSKL